MFANIIFQKWNIKFITQSVCLFNYRQQDSHHPIDPRLEAEHREYTELKFQGEEVDKKVEVYRPIVNLVHNMVNMGSLYGGDNFMLASQYRKVSIYTCMVNMGSL